MKHLKVAVIVPDRGDRHEFMEQCKKMIASQSYPVEQLLIANWESKSNECDITERYRVSYHYFDGLDYDCILFMENDDFYSSDYIETMICEWIKNGKPDIFGTGQTYYYHLGIRKYMLLRHYKRASMMNTLIKPDLHINWTVDNDPYTDMCLWKQLNGITFIPNKIFSIGIKHNIGKAGGRYHGDGLERYDQDDQSFEFLKSVTQDSFNFYKEIHEKICIKF